MPNSEQHHLHQKLEVPLEHRLEIDDILLEKDKDTVEKNKHLSKGLNDLREEYNGKIQSLIGLEKYRAHRGELDRIIEKFAEASLTKAGTTKDEHQRSKLKKEKHDFYHGLGFDTEKARKLRKDYQEKARFLVDKSLELDKEAPDEPNFGPPTLTYNPGKKFVAPFAAGNSGGYENGSRGSRSRSAWASAASGQLHSYGRMELYGADDSDWSTVASIADVGVSFRMPASGLVEVSVEFQDIDTDYSGHLWDESGCSDADIQQLSRVYLWTSGSTYRYSTMVDYRRNGDPGGLIGGDAGWSKGGPTAPGESKWVHLYSHRSYAVGDQVWVAVGVYDFNHFWVDDMSCRSIMRTDWLVKCLLVRSTGET